MTFRLISSSFVLTMTWKAGITGSTVELLEIKSRFLLIQTNTAYRKDVTRKENYGAITNIAGLGRSAQAIANAGSKRIYLHSV